MIDINTHPIWKGVSSVKKPFHLLRINLARQLARFIPRQKIIGITGSVGKTTTALASFSVLSQKYNTICTMPSLDTILNLPITLLKFTPKTQKIILELGVEFMGEMDFYLSIVKPATAIVTEVSSQHSEFLGDEESIAQEKSKLVEQLPDDGIAILNYDNTYARAMSEKTDAQIFYYGLDPEKCDLYATSVKNNNFQLEFGLHYGVERVEVKTKLLGKHFVYPLLAAAALGVVNDISLIKIKKGLEALEPPEHRLQAIPGFNGSIVLDDTYNAAPISVEQALETLSLLPARRRIVVLGEMRELGIYSEKFHRQIAQKIYKEKPDLVLLGTGDAKYIADELIKLGFILERLETNLKNQEILNHLLKILAKGDVVLIKGARLVRLDEVVDRVTKAVDNRLGRKKVK